MATKVITSRKLIKSASKDLWLHKSKIIGGLSIIAVPLSLLGLIPGLDQDAVYGAISTVARIIMITGLIWMIAQIKNNKSWAIGDVYYWGISSIIRLFLVVLSFFAMLTPFLVGSVFYAKGLEATVTPSSPEKLLLGVIWAVVGLPSIWLLTRFLLAMYVVIDQDTTPVKALRRANQLVRGQTIRVLGRIVALFVYSVLVLTVFALVAKILGSSPSAVVIFDALLQLMSALVILPIANLYLFNLYQSLNSKSSSK